MLPKLLKTSSETVDPSEQYQCSGYARQTSKGPEIFPLRYDDDFGDRETSNGGHGSERCRRTPRMETKWTSSTWVRRTGCPQ
jgi:hypothetical protein